MLGLALFAALTAASAIGSIAIPSTSTPPRVDGTLDDPQWKTGAVVELAHNLRDRGSPPDRTVDYVLTDGKFLYVGVDARQHTAVRAVQRTNDVGQDTDDEVQVDLWPNGPSGFRYLFISTALGTHYQASSENNAYDPTWWSAGKIGAGGFTVTMKIPLNMLHGTASGGWRIQFARLVMATNDDLVWSYGDAQQNHNDVNYAGTATGLPAVGALKLRPRIGVYALGAIASHAIGGSTSRGGVDLSVPVMPGTSFVATIHPDFSNVEADQQTIAPTAYPRFLNDYRPFFTQGANFYNTTPNCTDCPGTQLYTPGIPTPRDGYAVEGQRGLFSYAAFDAVGTGRSDSAQVINYASPNQQNLATVQRNALDMPGFKDDSINLSFTHDNLRNFSTWLRYANDSGTNVLAGDQAQRYEAGVNFYTPTSSLQAELRKVGQYFDPADGLIFHPDIAGYVVNAYKQFNYAPSSPFKQLQVQADLQRFHGHAGGLDQSNSSVSLSLTTRTLFNLQVTTGSAYTRLENGIFTPITQQGVQLTYDYGSATPTVLSFNTGRFGPGRLNAWLRSVTLRVGTRGAITVEADDTQQRLDSGARYVQWLERASFAYESGPDSSLAFGVRRIIGFQPYLASAAEFQNGWNLSAAYHRKLPFGELYIAYGDASAFSTSPQFIVKLIRYIGSDKGT